jgi:hypothetical protein
MMHALFKDIETQAQFERDGYAVINFAPAEVIKKIAERFYELYPIVPDGFSSAASDPDDEIKKRLFIEMDSLLGGSMDSTFTDYKKLGSTFLCKAPGSQGKVGVHQDWTIVDESKYSSATIWIPVQDVDEKNGALRVLPGSHLFFDRYRHNHIPISYRGSEELIWENMMTVPMKLGQAFVLNHAVIHGSPPNITDKERLIIAYGITSREAQLTFYYKGKERTDDKIEKFEMPDDFFLRYCNHGERPLFGKKVADINHTVPVVSEKMIQAMIYREKAKRKDIPYFQKNWTQKILATTV